LRWEEMERNILGCIGVLLVRRGMVRLVVGKGRGRWMQKLGEVELVELKRTFGFYV